MSEEAVKPDTSLTGRQKMWMIIIVAAMINANSMWNAYKNYQARKHEIDIGLQEAKATNRVLMDIIRRQASRDLDNKETLDDILRNREAIEIRM